MHCTVQVPSSIYLEIHATIFVSPEGSFVFPTASCIMTRQLGRALPSKLLILNLDYI